MENEADGRNPVERKVSTECAFPFRESKFINEIIRSGAGQFGFL